MNKNKKLFTSLVVLTASIGVFAVSTFAAAGNLSAYQKLKSYLIDSSSYVSSYDQTEKSHTTLTAQIEIDGAKVFDSVNTTKNDGVNFSSKTTTTVAGGAPVVDAYANLAVGEKTYVVYQGKDGLEGYTYNNSEDSVTVGYNGVGMYDDFDSTNTNNDMTTSQKNFVSALFDMFVGDAKNYVYESGDKFGIKLEGAQIPEIAQLGLTATVDGMKNEGRFDTHSSRENYQSQLKFITDLSNLRFTSITGEFDPNSLKSGPVGNGEITMVGTDASGKQVELKATFSGTSEALNGPIDFTEADLANVKIVEDNATNAVPAVPAIVVNY